MGRTLADQRTLADTASDELLAVARRLMGPARGLLGAGPAAEDLVYDTLAALLPRWHLIRGDKVAYARKALVNRFRDLRRHERVETTHQPTLAAFDQLKSPMDSVDQRVDMASALQRLPERVRQIVVLRHFMDLPATEVAEVLDIPASSVRRIAHQGLRMLAPILAAESEGSEREYRPNDRKSSASRT